MKKNVLALSIATMVGGLGFMGAANAELVVSESGAGHILLVPYYTAQNGNMSVFHVTNTDMTNGKAVKVRFRGASNSDDVLDFQVFLSPGDVWTAAVTKGENGLAQLTTHDNSCTIPAITPGKAESFMTQRLTREGWTPAQQAEQTLEGYVEILTMADVPSNSALYSTTKHNSSGVADCSSTILASTLAAATVAQLGNDNITLPSSTVPDLVIPTGGLVGQWYVLNVEKTTTYSGETPAIRATGTTKNVFSPQDDVAKSTKLLTADPLMVAGLMPALHFDVPDLSTPYEVGTNTAEEQAIALSKSLLKTAVMNQYTTDAGISAKTDWVFSMPTRRYTIAANYGAPVSQTHADTTASPETLKTAYRVINEKVTGNAFSTASNTTVNAAGQICLESPNSEFLDRSERKPSTPTEKPKFSPGSPKSVERFNLCGEVSVLAFSADESALGATVARQNITVPYANGWGTMTFAEGVPVLGAAFIKVHNPSSAPGVSGNYGLTWGHAYK